MVDESGRREKSGRRARGKGPKPLVQDLTKDPRRPKFGKQWTDPATGRRRWIKAGSPMEVLAIVSQLNATRMRARLGMLGEGAAATQAVREEVATVLSRGYLWEDAWKDWMRYGGLSDAWRSKANGLWRLHVGPRFKGKCLHETSGELMTRWLAWMREKRPATTTHIEAPATERLAWRTIDNVWHQIKSVIRFAIMQGKLASEPWGPWRLATSEMRKKKRDLGKKKSGFVFVGDLEIAMKVAREIATRAEHVAGDLPDLPRRLALMALLGLRRGEAIAFSWDHVHELPDGSGRIRIEHQAIQNWRKVMKEGKDGRPMWPCKWDSDGTLSVSSVGAVFQLLREQRAMLEARGMFRSDGPVFPDATGRYRARNVVDPELMRKIARRAGLEEPGRTWDQHSLRHSTARMLAAAGAHPTAVRDALRHSDLGTTQVYFDDVGKRIGSSQVDEALGARLPRDAPQAELSRRPQTRLDVDVDSPHPVERELRATEETQRDRAHRWRETNLGRRVERVSDFLDLDNVDDVGQPVRPVAVAAMGHRSYSRAYAAALREGCDKPEARERGRAAKRSLWGAYFTLRGKALERREEERRKKEAEELAAVAAAAAHEADVERGDLSERAAAPLAKVVVESSSRRTKRQ